MLLEQVSTIGGHDGGLTVTVKLQLVTTTPQSKALHVTVVVPMGKKLPLGGLQESVAGPQPPLTELVKKTFAPAPVPQLVALTTMFEEQVSTTGGHGLTVTLNEQFVLLPQLSVAMQVTRVVPSGKVLPLGGLQLTVVGPQPPVAELEKKTGTPALPQLVELTTMFEEQVSTIGGQGLTVTVNEQLVVLPQPSEPVQVTVVVPTGKVVPLGGLQTIAGLVQPPLTELL